MFKQKVQLFIISVTMLIAFIFTFFIVISYSMDYLYLFRPFKEARDKERLPTDKAIPLDYNMRIQAFGIINSYQFDSVILGTSMLENTSSQTCNTEIGGTFINLSMAGSSFFERKFVIDYILKNFNIKNIVYSFDMYYIDCLENGNEKYTVEDWAFIYGQQGINKYKRFLYYLNKNTIQTLLGSRKIEIKTPDRPCAWMMNPLSMRLFGGLDNWIKNQDEPFISNKRIKKFLHIDVFNSTKLALKHRKDIPVTDSEQFEKSIEYIYNNIFKYVNENKKTKFYFIFPPYWRLTYATWRQATPSLFALHQDVVRYVVLQAQLFGNVEIYGFEDCDFVNDIKNYRDTTHYHPSINEYITQSIGSGAHRLTPDNVEAYLARCERLASSFDLQAFAAEVKERLEYFHNQKDG